MNVPSVRSMRTELPMLAASFFIRDQSEADTVRSACTTTSLWT